MLTALSGGAPASTEEQARLTQCLDDDTVHLIFMTTIIPIPFSVETSACILAALDVIDPRAVMTAGLEGDPQTAMARSMAAFTVSVACLTDEEWERAALASGISDQDRAGLQCLMAELGGPGEYTEALIKTQEGDITELVQAGTECRVGISVPWQPPATPTPIPTPSQSGITTPTTLVITVAGIPEYD